MLLRFKSGRPSLGLSIAILPPLMALAACAPDLGPAAKARPSASYATARTFAAPAAAWPSEDWWTAYNDPQLTGLIEQALKDSPDLRVAQARLAQAQGARQEAGAVQGPNASAKGSIEETGVKIGFPNTPSQFSQLLPTDVQPFTQVGASLSYQLDFFGRNRAAVAAASSSAQASAFELAAARLQISTGVASAYADLVQALEDEAAARDAVDVRGQTRELVDSRLKNGLETQAEFKQSAATEAASQVDLILATGQRLKAQHALAALVGLGPDGALDLKIPTVLKTTPVGLPANLSADLIGRRPDIAAARLRAEAAADREKVARANFYPNFSLTGSATVLSLNPQSLLSHNLSLAQVGPAVTLPIFDSGKLAGQSREARGEYDEAVAVYDKTVVDALRDVGDALIIREGAQEALARAQQAMAASDDAYKLVRMRYTAGLTPFLSVLTAENTLVASRRQEADLRAQSLTADVMLTRALGGGFRDPSASSTQTNP